MFFSLHTHDKRHIIGNVILLALLSLSLTLTRCGDNDDDKGSDSSSDLKEAEGTLMALTDLVEWEGNAVTAPQIVKSNETIRTDDTGTGQLTFFEGPQIDLHPNTELLVEKLEQAPNGKVEVRLRQLAGDTFHRVKLAADTDSRYELETPVVHLVVRGTDFGVTVEPDGTSYIEVQDGTVAATVAERPYEIDAGEAIDVAADATTTGPYQYITPQFTPFPDISTTAVLPAGGAVTPPFENIPAQTMIVGEAYDLEYTYDDIEGDSLSVATESDDEAVVSVSGTSPGAVNLTANGPGTATVTVSITNEDGDTSTTTFSVIVGSLDDEQATSVELSETFNSTMFTLAYPSGWTFLDRGDWVLFANNQDALDAIVDLTLDPDNERIPPDVLVGVVRSLNDSSLTLTDAAAAFAAQYTPYSWGTPVPMEGTSAIVRMPVNGPFNNWVSFVSDLGDGWFALLVGTAAPGELAAFESTLLAVTQTLQLSLEVE